MSPPRRPTRRRGGTTPGQRTPRERRALEALLAKLEAAEAKRRAQPGKAGRPRANEAELEILRALVAKALDEDDDTGGEGADDDSEDAEWFEEGWEPGETWDEREAWSSWDEFPPSKPIPVEGGLVARTRRGAIGSTWWSQRFLTAIAAVMVGGRLDRGRSYARKGQVIDLEVSPGLIEAHVQGSRSTPYRVRLSMPVVPDVDWERILAALAAEAGYAARMLAGDLPHEVEDVFAAEGASLFPGPTARLVTECTCPDWANPCKHIAAVCYLVAEAFDRHPFGVLAWRGRERDAVLDGLRRLRTGAAPVADAPVPPPLSPPAVEVPPLADCVPGFWKAGPELAEVRVRPEAAELPGAVLRHLAAGLIEVRGKDVSELLGPAYAAFTAAAARRALGDGEL